ncbi:MAG: choice-of-anchor I domain-containing protein, partial [Steroidobacteraceae bacterium]
MIHRAVISTVSTAVALILAQAAAAHDDDGHHRRHSHADRIALEPISTFDAGGAGSAEIVEYDPGSKRLFVVNAQTRTVDVLDVRNPKMPTRITTIDTSALGAPNSVATHDGLVAVAIESDPKTAPGHVAFYRVNGELITAVQVGALPDMIKFTPNGAYALVANEAEPSGYGVGQVDPQGSVSIIPIPKSRSKVKNLADADVLTASFTKFDGQEASLRAQGIRVYGPGATASQDFEPEYIAISKDSRTAYVT